MAMLANPCSSFSIVITSSFSSTRHLEPTKSYPSPSWVSRNVSNLHQCQQFQLKFSKLLPPNALSLLPGMPGIPSTEERVNKQVEKSCIPLSGSGADSTLSIIVVGSSGNLAKSKIFPALFALFFEDCLPQNFTIFGYAWSLMADDELRNIIKSTLTCRIDEEFCDDKMNQFLRRCFYHSGQYSSEEHFLELDKKLKEKEVGKLANRLFYLSLPPSLCVDVARCARNHASNDKGWTRLIVEKSFGHDLESSRGLTRGLRQHFTEDQIFRINHQLGEEMIENLLVLRFSNMVFEPLWSRNCIRNVQMILSEDTGIEGCSRCFDNYGIFGDLMQNHLLQILALFAMETPVSLDAEDIRNEKVKVLRSIKPLLLEDVVVGQYKVYNKCSALNQAYTNTHSVPQNSLAPTFGAATLFIDNPRWEGVPFLMMAGKAVHSKQVEIRVQFRHVPGNLFKKNYGTVQDMVTNELVLSAKPDEAVYLKINTKVPGLGMRLDSSQLDLLQKPRYAGEVPNAYGKLLLDAVEGERRMFIGSDEIDASWALFAPLLMELEKKRVMPELYSYGSRRPTGAHYLAAKHGVRLDPHS